MDGANNNDVLISLITVLGTVTVAVIGAFINRKRKLKPRVKDRVDEAFQRLENYIKLQADEINALKDAKKQDDIRISELIEQNTRLRIENARYKR